MVRFLELLVGLAIILGSGWAFLNPVRDFRIGVKISPQYWGVRNKEQLEPSEFRILLNRIGYGLLILLGLFLVLDSYLGITVGW